MSTEGKNKKGKSTQGKGSKDKNTKDKSAHDKGLPDKDTQGAGAQDSGAQAKVAVMDQYAHSANQQGADVVRSGLAHVGLPADGSTKKGQSSSVTLTERPVTGLLMLRAADEATALGKALKHHCGISLSTRLQSETQGNYCVRWMAPDSWLLSCPIDETFAIEQALRDAVPGHIAIVNVSGGYTIIELSGADARTVLMKSTGYDVHPEHFGKGKVVNTTFAKAQVTIGALDVSDTDARYELIVRRSFTDYLWLWLQRASAEFNLKAISVAG